MLALVCLHVACFAWIDQELGGDPFSGSGARIVAGLALVDALLVVLAERFAKGREREILTLAAAYFGLAIVLPFGVLAMIGELEQGGGLGLVVLILGLVVIWSVYRWRRPSLGMLAAFACVVTILITALVGWFLFDGLEAELFGVAALGAVICLQVWGFTRWLLDWRREHALAQPNSEVRDDAA
jgi:hypothetical protein